jgi:hypothetical protein
LLGVGEHDSALIRHHYACEARLASVTNPVLVAIEKYDARQRIRAQWIACKGSETRRYERRPPIRASNAPDLNRHWICDLPIQRVLLFVYSWLA